MAVLRSYNDASAQGKAFKRNAFADNVIMATAVTET